MTKLESLDLKNGNMLIELPGEGEHKVGNVSLWVPRLSSAKGVVFGTVVAKCDTIEDPDYAVGSKVMANRFNTGIEIEYAGQTMHLLKSANIIAVVKGDTLKGKNESILIDVPHETVTNSGLFISQKARFGQAITGQIETVGDDVQDQDYQPGKTAVFERNSATEIELGPKRLFIIEEEEVIGLEGNHDNA